MRVSTTIHSIRPAGRHLLTIGRELIQDKHAAIIELVKNAYDADSPTASIWFKIEDGTKGYSIVIEDQGHGMDYETVTTKWLVPSTDDKLSRKVSPKGRVMQGRKGVGRYAASILGRDLLLETVTEEGNKTSICLVWDAFSKAEYLSDVEILVESTASNEPSGTRLTITGSARELEEWTQDQFDELQFELKKLTSPFKTMADSKAVADGFLIHLKVDPFQGTSFVAIDEDIEPYPIFELYDYRITGSISSNGNGSFTYSTQKARNTLSEIIEFKDKNPTRCGELFFDIRVYDRDKEAIDSLIARGLKDAHGSYVGKLQARQLLNKYNGIGVYRNGFRIRPLGDADYDWLELNKQRVQNPSMKIGSDQAIGYVAIQSEEHSGLVEKSARDGLKENEAYRRLKEVSKEVISLLEARRFTYRKKAGLSRSVLRIERELESLFAFDDLRREVRRKLAKKGVDNTTAEEIIQFITKEENSKNRIAEEIKEIVAIYQGQATLGKIINVILHEGRRPLSYFKNQIPTIEYWYKQFTDTGNLEYVRTCIPLIRGIPKNAEVFVRLFSRLDPLASGRRGSKQEILWDQILHEIIAVFKNELSQSEIDVMVECPDGLSVVAWPQDIYTIFTNLLDNSIYWISNARSQGKKIQIELAVANGKLSHIDYRDSGPGIEPTLIESEVIFEPEFSTKPGGTGLGLAIAGEAAHRSGFSLRALESAEGAYFRIQPTTNSENEAAAD